MSPETNYQSPRLELQQGSPHTQSLLNQSNSPRNTYGQTNSSLGQYKPSQQAGQKPSPRGELDSQSPLIRRSGDSTNNYTSLLRSSLEQKVPTGQEGGGRHGNGVSLDYGNGRTPSEGLRQSYRDDSLSKNGSVLGDKQNYSADKYRQNISPSDRPASKESDPLQNLSSFRKSLLSDYSGLSSGSKLIQEHDSKIKAAQKHQQTPQATETYTTGSGPGKYSSPSTQRTEDSTSLYKSSPRQPTTDRTPTGDRQQLSVFNYEGGDRSQSRNQLHMLMNHNHHMMNAHTNHQQDSDSNNKKKTNLKKSRKKITVNLQGTRYEIGKELITQYYGF